MNFLRAATEERRAILETIESAELLAAKGNSAGVRVKLSQLRNALDRPFSLPEGFLSVPAGLFAGILWFIRYRKILTTASWTPSLTINTQALEKSSPKER